MSATSSRLVIFDRDGTLIQTQRDYIRNPDQIQPIEGALEAMARLSRAGWSVAIATNQPGLGRGVFDMATLNAVHVRLAQKLAEHGGRIDGVFFCPHTPEEACHCRKPEPGLYEDIGRRFGVELSQVPAIGDALVDVLAAQSAGCEPHLVRTGKAAAMSAEELAQMRSKVPGLTIHESLGDFVDHLLARQERDWP